MIRRPQRVKVHIDRITIDRTGLERSALEQALKQAVSQTLVEKGIDGFGTGGYRPRIQAEIPAGRESLPTRIAVTTIKAVTR